MAARNSSPYYGALMTPDPDVSPDEPSSRGRDRGALDLTANIWGDPFEREAHGHLISLYCIPVCCFEHNWKKCQFCYIVSIFTIFMLAVIVVAESIHYGFIAQHAAVQTVFMSANETYNTSSKPQNLLLQSVCLQVPMDAANWSLTKGSCNPEHITDTHTFHSNATKNVGYLVYLLVESVVTMNVTNNAIVKVYQASDASDVEKLEQKCTRNETAAYNCRSESTCEYEVSNAAHYYICLLLPPPSLPPVGNVEYYVNIRSVQYATSNFKSCDVNVFGTQCCKLSLSKPDCIFIQSNTTEESHLHKAVGVTLHGNKRHGVIGALIALTLCLAAIVTVLLLFCMSTRYKARHRDQCNCQISCFQIPN